MIFVNFAIDADKKYNTYVYYISKSIDFFFSSPDRVGILTIK